MVAAVLGSFDFKLEVQHKYISNYSTAPNQHYYYQLDYRVGI